MQQDFYAVGLMSGSSLDGLDLCYVHFIRQDNSSFSYKIIHSDYVAYDDIFREQLKQAPELSAFAFAKLHADLGRFFGMHTLSFFQKYAIDKIDFICSHGQTVFHQPTLNFSSQIGCGATIAQITKVKTISDLRMSDAAAGGQGAPIVPIAEKYLFPDFNIFLNIGGICNIAFHNNNQILAYDVCAGNTLLNYLAKEKKKNYDEGGILARKGNICNELLETLNAIDFCKTNPPKSLGTEHIYKDWIHITNQNNSSTEDKLATCVEHIAMQIGKQTALQSIKDNQQILVTGGGAFNQFLMERIQYHTKAKVIIPDKETIENKEALAIAFFGLLRFLKIPNCLSSVTGAKKDVTGGAIYLP